MKTTLFKPLAEDSDLALKNRIVMAPMTRSRAVGSVPNDIMAAYYAQRSSTGLIITEGVAPSPNALGYARIPGVFSDEQTEAWKNISDAVHEKGGKIFMQIMHTGRIAHPDNLPEGGRVLAPSDIPADTAMWTDVSGMQPLPQPEAMSLSDIEETVDEFATAAKNAVEAGFDGVELHGANGYLIEQFLNPQVNRREDRYGGSITNRVRFALEVTRSVANAIGPEKTGIRLSPYNTFNDMPGYDETFNTYKVLVEQLDALNIGYVHVVETAAKNLEEGRRLLALIRETFDNLLIVNGGYTRETAEEALAEERADLVSFGRPFVSNPDLPKRLEQGIPLAAPDRDTFYTPGEKGYTDYSFSEN